MAIAVAVAHQELRETFDGRPTVKSVLTITGLTAAAANTVPHGLPRTPKSVSFVGYNTAAAYMQPPSLNGSSVAGGWDGTNLYLFTPASTTMCQAIVEY